MAKRHEFGRAIEWALVSKHGMVIIVLAQHPDISRKDLAETVGISPRHATTIQQDLQEANMVQVEKNGRYNRYHVNFDAPLIAPSVQHLKLGQFLRALRQARQGGPLFAAAERGAAD